MDVMADSSAAYVVFDTVCSRCSINDKKELVKDSQGYPILEIENSGYASRIISGAKKNAENEIGKLLLRNEAVFMPIYFYEQGEDNSQYGAYTTESVFLTLSYYYKAYLYAWLMNIFLDMDEGKYM